MKKGRSDQNTFKSHDFCIDGGMPIPQDKPFSTRWQKILAVSALLDFLATWRFFIEPPTEDQVAGYFNIFGHDFPSLQRLFSMFFFWLDRHSSYIGLLFSFMWCIAAFIMAENDATRAFREWRRRQIMRNLHEAIKGKTEKQPTVVSHFERYKTYGIYYAALTLQFLLLPVGFYYFLYITVIPKRQADSSNPEEEIRALLESTYDMVDLPRDFRSFGNETKLALGFAIAKHTGIAVYRAGDVWIRKLLWRQSWKKGRRGLLKFLKHPIRNWKQGRKVLYLIRWITYLRPLLNGIAKVKHSIDDLLLTYKQYRGRKIAKKIRAKIRKEMNKYQRRVLAAKTIQKTYRSYIERQACVELVLAQRKVDEIAARKIQQACRKMAAQMKARACRTRKELRVLELRHSVNTRNAKTLMTMDPKDRDRIFELRQQLELPRPASIDQRLLMRPDSIFQLIWKSLFVCCIVVEMAGRMLEPILRLEIDKATGEPFKMSTKLQAMLIPTSRSRMSLCSCTLKRKKRFKIWGTKHAVTESCESKFWYCHPIYFYAESAYTRAVRFMIEECMVLMGVIMLLDVPVFFFTGRYQEPTLVLTPKPWFNRWISPGLLLQLIVNPKMETISKLVFKLTHNCFQVGPERTFRWARALFYPLFLLLFDLAEKYIWIPLVGYTNRTKKGKDDLRGCRRSTIYPGRQSIFLSAKTLDFAELEDFDLSRLSFSGSLRVYRRSTRLSTLQSSTTKHLTQS